MYKPYLVVCLHFPGIKYKTHYAPSEEEDIFHFIFFSIFFKTNISMTASQEPLDQIVWTTSLHTEPVKNA